MEMYKSKETGDFVWIFPLLAGICALIAILTPTASYSMMGISWSWWMWDFSVMTYIGYPPVSFFVTELDFIIPSIITTSAMLLSVVNLFILAGTTKKRKLNTKDFVLMSLISALLSIGIMIYYAFAVAFAFNDGMIIEGVTFPPGFHFWSEFNASFGMVLPFISAILSFIGLGLFRHYVNQRGDFAPIKTVTPTKEVVTPPKSSVTPPKYQVATRYAPASVPTTSLPTGARNYCPECGKKITRTDAHFCTNCGFKL
jgi:hypothetical protein